MIFVGGQVDLDSVGQVRHPGDLAHQTAEVVAYIDRVLADLGNLNLSARLSKLMQTLKSGSGQVQTWAA